MRLYLIPFRTALITEWVTSNADVMWGKRNPYALLRGGVRLSVNSEKSVRRFLENPKLGWPHGPCAPFGTQPKEVNIPQRCLHRQVHSCTYDSYIVESTQVSIHWRVAKEKEVSAQIQWNLCVSVNGWCVPAYLCGFKSVLLHMWTRMCVYVCVSACACEDVWCVCTGACVCACTCVCVAVEKTIFMCWSSPFCLVWDRFFPTVLAHREPVSSWGVSLEEYTRIRDFELLCRLFCRYWGSKVSTFTHWHLNPHNGILYSNKKKHGITAVSGKWMQPAKRRKPDSERQSSLVLSCSEHKFKNVCVCVLYVCRLWTQKGGHGRGLRDLCGCGK